MICLNLKVVLPLLLPVAVDLLHLLLLVVEAVLPLLQVVEAVVLKHLLRLKQQRKNLLIINLVLMKIVVIYSMQFKVSTRVIYEKL
jgi:hypothetical protein